MKTAIIIVSLFAFACNNAGKDSVEKADSANKSNLDTALSQNSTVIDEASSEFIVRIANSGAAEEKLAAIAHEKAAYPDVKAYGEMLHHEHMALNDSIRLLAFIKKIVLPTTVTDDKQAAVTALQNKAGKELDKEFINSMVEGHSRSIEAFENAILGTKDQDIRAFADRTLPKLKEHLAQAKALQKKYW